MSIQKVDKTTGDVSLLAGSTLWADSPIGTILPYGGASAPSGWFLCQGQAVSRTTYAELFAVIGESFGAGDGSTTFNLPDMRESVPKGAGLTGKTVGNHLDADGLAVGEFLDDRVQQHQHSMREAYVGTTTSGNPIGQFKYNQSSLADGITGNITNARSNATTEVKSVGVNYIIKAKMVAMPSDFMGKVDEVVSDMFLVVNNAINISGSITGGQDLKINMPTPPSGYKYFCCDLRATGDTYVFPRAWSSDEIYIHNFSTANKNYSLKVDITYIKSN